MDNKKLTFKELKRKHLVFNNPLADQEVNVALKREIEKSAKDVLYDQSNQEKEIKETPLKQY
jgi:hypothetical protein